MIEANLIEETAGEPRHLGRFEFLQLPAPGDHVLAPHRSGHALGEFRVLRVEHFPAVLPPPKVGRFEAAATVFVTHVRDRD